MSNQIPKVLYTEQKTKKVKIWLDGYLIPRPTLNSARLISAGKHEIDVVFYSSIDDIKPGREFETDRYLISVEDSNDHDQPCPRPSFAVNDPTMKNRPKSAAFVPPRLVPKPEPPPAPIPSLERHNPHQWGYTGMTTAMKRSIYEDDDNDKNSNYVSKITKSSAFIPPAFQKYESVRSEEPPQQSFLPPSPLPLPPAPVQQPGLLNDALVSRLLNNSRAEPIKSSPIKQTPHISWSTWDDKTSDDEDLNRPSISHDENHSEQQPFLTRQTFNWHSLVKSVDQLSPVKNLETMPKFDFDDNSFDTLFDNLND